jgi:hypothetical protein
MPGYARPQLTDSVSANQIVFTPQGSVSSTNVQGAVIEVDEQSVRVFSDSAARSSAIPSPTAGMTTYINSSKTLEYYDGTTWSAVGSGSMPIDLLLIGA